MIPQLHGSLKMGKKLRRGREGLEGTSVQFRSGQPSNNIGPAESAGSAFWVAVRLPEVLPQAPRPARGR